ncbi:hypothetical protein, partial [Parvibium lacunae]
YENGLNGIQTLGSTLVGTLVGALGGKLETAAQTAQYSYNADVFNRQLHPSEVKKLAALRDKFAVTLAKEQGRAVSAEEAERWLSTAALTNVDDLNQKAYALDKGSNGSQEHWSFNLAKQFISQESKGLGTWVDEQGVVRQYFIEKNAADRQNNLLYAQVGAQDTQWREFMWRTQAVNVLPNNATAEQQALYQSREKELTKQKLMTGGIAIVTGGAAALAPKVISKLPSSPAQSGANTKTKVDNNQNTDLPNVYDRQGGNSASILKEGELAASKVKWVDENAGMSQAARNYNDSATGARSNPATQSGQAPALERTMPDGSIRQVKFDGVDGDVMIDRKISVVTTDKAKDQALRQSEALSQNGLTGRWEVSSDAQAARATKMLNDLGIKNIQVKVVKQ